jgi:hypothetical protein
MVKKQKKVDKSAKFVDNLSEMCISNLILFSYLDSHQNLSTARWISYPRADRSSDYLSMVIPITYENIHYPSTPIPALSTTV